MMKKKKKPRRALGILLEDDNEANKSSMRIDLLIDGFHEVDEAGVT